MQEPTNTIDLQFQPVHLGTIVKNGSDICFTEDKLLCLNGGDLKICRQQPPSDAAQALKCTPYSPDKSITSLPPASSQLVYSRSTGQFAMPTGDSNKAVTMFGVKNPFKGPGVPSEASFGPQDQYLAMKFKSTVTRVLACPDNAWILAFSNDECAQIYNSEQKATLTCSPGHPGHSAKGGQINTEGQYVASTGTDGRLNVYKISQGADGPTLKQEGSLEVSTRTSSLANPFFDFSIHWLPNSETLLVSGNEQLGFVSKDENEQWSLSLEDSVSHSKPISSLLAISEAILLTYSVEEKTAKIWRFGEEGCECIWRFRHHTEIRSIAYSEQTSSVAFLDIKGEVSVLHGDFSKSEVEVEALMPTKVTDEFEEFDIADFEMPEDLSQEQNPKPDVVRVDDTQKSVEEIHDVQMAHEEQSV